MKTQRSVVGRVIPRSCRQVDGCLLPRQVARQVARQVDCAVTRSSWLGCLPAERKARRRTHAVRRGYTLLELILSLALTVVVFMGIAAAMSVFYSALTGQQRLVEQELIGRSILNMIAADLRAGLQYKAADVAGIENLVVSEALAAGIGGGAAGGAGAGTGSGGEGAGDDEAGDDSADGGGTGDSGTGGGTGGTGTGGTGTGGGTAGTAGGTGAATDEEESDPAEEDNAWYRPSFVGNASQFTLDISRLPRIDQVNALTSDLSATATPADLKRVAWMVMLDGAPQANSLDPAADAMGGLYRREVDRAVSAFSREPDMPSSPDQYSRLLATEVISLQFRYFDGENWKTEWESASVGGYPLAVEVRLLLDPDRSPDAPPRPGGQNNTPDFENARLFRTVVHLPVAEIMPPEEESGE